MFSRCQIVARIQPLAGYKTLKQYLCTHLDIGSPELEVFANKDYKKLLSLSQGAIFFAAFGNQAWR